MRWLKHTVSLVLLLAAVAVALVAAFSDHSADYGRVAVPQGGIVHLPKGKVTVFYEAAGQEGGSASGAVAFQVVPVGGGAPVPVTSEGGAGSAVVAKSSETIGDLGAVAKLGVPSEGDYVVSVSADLPAGSSSLSFGTNAGEAVLHHWKLLAGLVLAAFLIALIPVPRGRSHWEDDGGAPSEWSSDPRAPYAG